MGFHDVKVDSRQHISLSFRTAKHDWYLAEEDPDGTIHLYPGALVAAKLRKPASAGTNVLEREREPMEVLRDFFPDAEEVT